MARKRRSRVGASIKKRYTSPRDLPHTIGAGHVRTPARSSIIAAKLIEQELKIKIDGKVKKKLFGVPERDQTRILKEKQPRTRHNWPDTGPDPRGRRRALTAQDTRAIYNFVTDPNVPEDDRKENWPDLAELAGVDLPKVTSWKPEGEFEVSARTISKACYFDHKIGNYVMEEEKELTPAQAEGRTDWIDIELPKRPHSKDWEDCVFCDKFQHGKMIKLPEGRDWRQHPMNVQKKKKTSKELKEKARKDGHDVLLSVFVVVGMNYRRMVSYEVPNGVGKMTTEVYTKHILPSITPELIDQGLTLVQDADSAHTSRGTTKWAKDNGLSLLTLPGKSPDFSIIETMANPIKKKFFNRRTRTEKAGMARFTKVWEEEIDQEQINGLYTGYTRRFHEARERKGQMTHF